MEYYEETGLFMNFQSDWPNEHTCLSVSRGEARQLTNPLSADIWPKAEHTLSY